MKIGDEVIIKLSVKDIAIISDLLELASNGWYTDEVYNKDNFKSPKQQEKHVIKLLKKIIV